MADAAAAAVPRRDCCATSGAPPDTVPALRWLDAALAGARKGEQAAAELSLHGGWAHGGVGRSGGD